MRIMVIESADSSSDGLTSRLAAGRGLTLIPTEKLLQGRDGNSAPTTEQTLAQAEFLLAGGPETPERAAALNSLLKAQNSPLDLVIAIDETREIPADAPPAADPVRKYYREHGLLRRVRCEGGAAERLAAADRMIDDLARSRRPEAEDPFTAALQVIERGAPPEATGGDEGETPELSAETKRPSPSWKRTAVQKGRLQRQQTRAKEGRKPRR